MLVMEEKIAQAAAVMRELDIDLWLTFVRESATLPDPAIDLVVGQHCTWQTAWILGAQGERLAVAGSLDVAAIKDRGLFTTIVPYVEGIGGVLREQLVKMNPRRMAINFSRDSVMADGLSHGMYLHLCDILADTGLVERFVSSEGIMAALRGRKTAAEVAAMQAAIDVTLEIYAAITEHIRPGVSEQALAAMILAEVQRRGLETAWDEAHCPAVFTGPEHAGAHFRPTERLVEAGHVVNMDFGVKVDGYCSDLQRTWYVRRPGETCAPAEVERGFTVIRDAIRKAAAALRPGAVAWEVDQAARAYIMEAGYPDFPHGLGHQVGRSAHDGGIGLFPRWERYGQLPYGKVEVGQVFTIEPRLPIEGYGVATVEEMVWVTEDGCHFLSSPQESLLLV